MLHRRQSSSGSGVTRPGRSATTTRPPATVDLGHQRLHERHQRVAAVGRADREQVLGAAVHQAGDLAERGAVEVVRRQPDQLVVVELVGVLGRLVGRDRGVQQDARAPPRRRCGPGSPRSAPAASTSASGGSPRSAVRRVVADPDGASTSSTEPGANRRSGSSVRTLMVTSPRRPWALPIRPTRTSMVSTLSSLQVVVQMQNGCRPGGRHPFKRSYDASATPVDVDEVDPRAAATRESGDRRCGTPWRCGRCDRSPCRGRRGGPGPRGSSRDAAACRARARRRGGRRRHAPGARAHRRAWRSGLRLLGALGGLGLLGRDLRGLVSGTGEPRRREPRRPAPRRGSPRRPGLLGGSVLGLRLGLLLRAAFLVTASPLGSLAASLSASLKISSLSRLGSA